MCLCGVAFPLLANTGNGEKFPLMLFESLTALRLANATIYIPCIRFAGGGTYVPHGMVNINLNLTLRLAADCSVIFRWVPLCRAAVYFQSISLAVESILISRPCGNYAIYGI